MICFNLLIYFEHYSEIQVIFVLYELRDHFHLIVWQETIGKTKLLDTRVKKSSDLWKHEFTVTKTRQVRTVACTQHSNAILNGYTDEL